MYSYFYSLYQDLYLKTEGFNIDKVLRYTEALLDLYVKYAFFCFYKFRIVFVIQLYLLLSKYVI